MKDEAFPPPNSYPSIPRLHEPDSSNEPPVARSIFTLPFRHHLHERCYNEKNGRQRADKAATELVRLGWRMHPDVYPARTNESRFSGTFDLFTPALRSALLDAENAVPCQRFRGYRNGDLDRAEIRRRLGAASGINRRATREWPLSLILSRDSAPLRTDNERSEVSFERLQFRLEDPTFQLGRLDLWFRICWCDCWLLDNGVGVLAVSVELESAQRVWSHEGQAPQAQGHMRIGALARLNRVLRDLNPPRREENPYISVSMKNENGRESQAPIGINHFWNDFILPWVGGDGLLEQHDFGSNPANIEVDESWAGGALANLAQAVSPISRYAKTLTMAAVVRADEAEWSKWILPAGEPGMDLSRLFAATNDTLPVTALAQRSLLAGMPTVRDMLVYDLATTSDEGNAWGFDQLTGRSERGWKPDFVYVNDMFTQSGIHLWEYWTGISLRESTAFVAFDPSMPIRWQMNTRYYGIFVYTHALRYKLDLISQDIIDHDLYDFARERELRDEFSRFRSVYWFQEVTTDFQGREIFNAMRSGMHVDEIYRTVCEEIRDVGGFIEEKTRLIRQAVISFVALALFLGSFRDQVWSPLSGLVVQAWQKAEQWTEPASWAAQGGIVLLVVVGAVSLFAILAIVSSLWVRWVAGWRWARRLLFKQG